MDKNRLKRLIMRLDLEIAANEGKLTIEGMSVLALLSTEFKDVHKAARDAVKELSMEEPE